MILGEGVKLLVLSQALAFSGVSGTELDHFLLLRRSSKKNPVILKMNMLKISQKRGNLVPVIRLMNRDIGSSPKWRIELQIHPERKASRNFGLNALHNRKPHALAPRKKKRDVFKLVKSGSDTPIPTSPIKKEMAAINLG